MDKKIDSMREARRRYEETHREERKQRNGQFSTFIPRADFEEINAFLNEHNLTKVQLVYVGYQSLKELYTAKNNET